MKRAKKRRNFIKSFFVAAFIFGIFFPGAKMFAAGNGLVSALEGAQTSTPTPLASPTTTPSQPASSSSVLEAFIQAPPGVVAQPYIILSAVELSPNPGLIVIKGSFSDKSFVCESTPCLVYLTQSDNISFRAYSDTGSVSDEVFASVEVDQSEDGFVVQLNSINKYTTFSDACRSSWNLLPSKQTPAWAEFPQFSFQLNTQRTLHYLAAKLIVNGIVDVSACPDGGVSANLSWPTGCGLVQAKDKMIEWQNQYDPYIWTASKDVGIPPKILKTLIQTESQFWPANQRFYVDEYGLGQVTQLGLDVLLRSDPSIYQTFCPKVLAYCNTFYTNLSPADQALVRGAFLDSLDATCPTCENGFDFTQAGRSVFYVARLLKANCQQTGTIVKRFGTFSEMEYDDYWKFTLFNYHSGIVCFNNAVAETIKANQDLVWENLSENTSCVDGKTYVDGIWGSLVSFDLYLYQESALNTAFSQPVFEAPPTPTALPTAIPSNAQIKVQVWRESSDGSREPLNNLPVFLSLEDGTRLLQKTSNGETVFDMRGYTAGIDATVSLPGLYRTTSFVLPAGGVKEIVFVFASPILPPSLP